MLKNKNILIGITGSIAAYKTCDVIRILKLIFSIFCAIEYYFVENAKICIFGFPKSTKNPIKLTIEDYHQTNKLPAEHNQFFYTKNFHLILFH